MLRVTGCLVSILVLVAFPLLAHARNIETNGELADSASSGLAVYVGAGALGSPGTFGSDVALGLRLRAAPHVALELDTAYGLVGSSGVAQDRWWAIPGVAAVLPLGNATLDLGAGMGVGTTSGYESWTAYEAAPFEPTSHHTVVAGQLHAALTLPISHQFDALMRVQAGRLLDGLSLSAADGTWLGLTLGVQARIL